MEAPLLPQPFYPVTLQQQLLEAIEFLLLVGDAPVMDSELLRYTSYFMGNRDCEVEIIQLRFWRTIYDDPSFALLQKVANSYLLQLVI